MNNVERIKAELKRLYNQSLVDENRQAELGLKSAACTSYGKSKVCKELLSFIDSMQEEPVSIDFEQELYKAFGQVKDFTLGMRIAKWFYDMGKNSKESQEPVSEDLYEAAENYAATGEILPNGKEMISFDALKAFKAGAEWQKAQLLAGDAMKEVKGSFGGEIKVDLYAKLDNGGYIDFDPGMKLNPACGVKIGNRVRIIVMED